VKSRDAGSVELRVQKNIDLHYKKSCRLASHVPQGGFDPSNFICGYRAILQSALPGHKRSSSQPRLHCPAWFPCTALKISTSSRLDTRNMETYSLRGEQFDGPFEIILGHTLKRNIITAFPGPVFDFYKLAKHTPFVHLFCFDKIISRTMLILAPAFDSRGT
jgi:hypothetical protein